MMDVVDGKCTCPNGYYYYRNGKACKACSPLCDGCTGGTAKECKRCADLPHVIKKGDECVCATFYVMKDKGVCEVNSEQVTMLIIIVAGALILMMIIFSVIMLCCGK